MKFFIKKIMTENEKNIEKALGDLKEWILSLQKQSKTGTLDDKESKLLFEIRDMAKGIKKPVPVPDPQSNPIPKSPPVDYMEMRPADLFPKLGSKRNIMSSEQHMAYDRLLRHFEEEPLSLSWGDVNFLRRLYGTLFYRQ